MAGSGLPQRQGVGVGQDGVAEVVADHRLDAIREIREEHRMRGFARRRGAIFRVDRLEHHPIGVDVEPAFAAAEGDAHAFGCSVFVEDRAVERPLEVGACGGRQKLAARPNDHGCDAQAAGHALLREKGQHGRITCEDTSARMR